MNRLRRYLTPAVVTVFIFALAATALAVAGDLVIPNENASETAKAKIEAAKAEAQKERSEEEGEAAEAQGEGSATENHGHCVSYWARAANDAGLNGRARGEFISTVAQDEDAVSAKLEGDAAPTGDCGDYQATLNSAVAAQGQSAINGGGEGNGRPGSAGNSAGKGKSDEHRPDLGS